MFWSEIESGFGELGSTPLPKILRSKPPSPPPRTGMTQELDKPEPEPVALLTLISLKHVTSLFLQSFIHQSIPAVFVFADEMVIKRDDNVVR